MPAAQTPCSPPSSVLCQTMYHNVETPSTEALKPAVTRWDAFIALFLRIAERFKYYFAAFWFAMLVASAVLGPRLLTATSSQYDPPDNTEAARANSILAREFPSIGKTATLGVLVQSLDGPQVRRQRPFSLCVVFVAGYFSWPTPTL